MINTCLNVDARLVNIEKSYFDLGLSFYSPNFQNIYSIADSLYKELTVLLKVAKQVPESEAAEAAS
jgi:hypothetical protein